MRKKEEFQAVNIAYYAELFNHRHVMARHVKDRGPKHRRSQERTYAAGAGADEICGLAQKMKELSMDADIGAQSNSLGKFGKITEHPQSGALALFGMELGRVQIVAPNHRAERVRIGCLARHDGLVFWHDIVGVDKVKMRLILDALKDWRAVAITHLVPAHMGHFQLTGNLELSYFARQYPQSLVNAILIAAVK